MYVLLCMMDSPIHKIYTSESYTVKQFSSTIGYLNMITIQIVVICIYPNFGDFKCLGVRLILNFYALTGKLIMSGY